jgi:hypothetical protein
LLVNAHSCCSSISARVVAYGGYSGSQGGP